MSSATSPEPHPHQRLLSNGVPAWQVALQVEKHIQALEALPADTEDREEALATARTFFDTLPKH